MKFIRESIAWTAPPISSGASALNHEIGNHAVKRQAIVEVLLVLLPAHFIGELFGSFRQAYEIGNGLGGLLLQQTNDNITLRSLEYRVRSSRSSHEFSS